jgi:hypothetical protein
MKKLALAALFLAALASPAGAVTTVKTAVLSTAWTDLGAGPMLLSFTGVAYFAVADTTPVATIPVGEGFQILSGSSFRIDSTSHIWVSSPGNAGVNAYSSVY